MELRPPIRIVLFIIGIILPCLGGNMCIENGTIFVVDPDLELNESMTWLELDTSNYTFINSNGTELDDIQFNSYFEEEAYKNRTEAIEKEIEDRIESAIVLGVTQFVDEIKNAWNRAVEAEKAAISTIDSFPFILLLCCIIALIGLLFGILSCVRFIDRRRNRIETRRRAMIGSNVEVYHSSSSFSRKTWAAIASKIKKIMRIEKPPALVINA